jgi:hypothetical protein
MQYNENDNEHHKGNIKRVASFRVLRHSSSNDLARDISSFLKTTSSMASLKKALKDFVYLLFKTTCVNFNTFYSVLSLVDLRERSANLTFTKLFFGYNRENYQNHLMFKKLECSRHSTI